LGLKQRSNRQISKNVSLFRLVAGMTALGVLHKAFFCDKSRSWACFRSLITKKSEIIHRDAEDAATQLDDFSLDKISKLTIFYWL
jgi:hypothetical protein